ncbi:hypothetical protein F511_10638 [Dorcoceras hygrometricum]|uniref:Secreted protein n=1 Tax=Dorcoceras hygrometricum TaxID=472368 RepID=A0A2Z7CGB4_9LAMI|nr:hypothetical protein F511_10638 [Dorcoceras hygrometricum]
MPPASMWPIGPFACVLSVGQLLLVCTHGPNQFLNYDSKATKSNPQFFARFSLKIPRISFSNPSTDYR